MRLRRWRICVTKRTGALALRRLRWRRADEPITQRYAEQPGLAPPRQSAMLEVWRMAAPANGWHVAEAQHSAASVETFYPKAVVQHQVSWRDIRDGCSRRRLGKRSAHEQPGLFRDRRDTRCYGALSLHAAAAVARCRGA